MKRIEINWTPALTDIEAAFDFAEANEGNLAAAGRAGDQDALRLWAAYQDCKKDGDPSGVWLTHFYAVYVASRTVQS